MKFGIDGMMELMEMIEMMELEMMHLYAEPDPCYPRHTYRINKRSHESYYYYRLSYEYFLSSCQVHYYPLLSLSKYSSLAVPDVVSLPNAHPVSRSRPFIN